MIKIVCVHVALKNINMPVSIVHDPIINYYTMKVAMQYWKVMHMYMDQYEWDFCTS
jgi:hypothetical protein